MFSKEDIEKIDLYLHKNFDVIFDFKFDGLILLFGGAIKDLIMDKPINDLDFVLLSQGKGNIREFVDRINVHYTENRYGSYRFFYNNLQIDFSVTNDLYTSGNLNYDRLFFDINRKQIIPIGIKYMLKKNTIIEYYYHGYYKIKKRVKKAALFINFMNKNDKKVKIKYKYNRIFCLCCAVIKKISKMYRRNKKYAKCQ